MVTSYVKKDDNFDNGVIILKSYIRTRLRHVCNISSQCTNLGAFI